MKIKSFRKLERFVTILAWALVALLIVSVLFSCQTMAAVEKLPQGYGTATWGLVEGIVADVWSVVRFVVGL